MIAIPFAVERRFWRSTSNWRDQQPAACVLPPFSSSFGRAISVGNGQLTSRLDVERREGSRGRDATGRIVRERLSRRRRPKRRTNQPRGTIRFSALKVESVSTTSLSLTSWRRQAKDSHPLLSLDLQEYELKHNPNDCYEYSPLSDAE
jgi:hypothetical protein